MLDHLVIVRECVGVRLETFIRCRAFVDLKAQKGEATVRRVRDTLADEINKAKARIARKLARGR